MADKQINRQHITAHAPGAIQAYRDGCRCYPCSDGWARYQKGRLSSDWKPFVDAEIVRAHLEYLHANDMPFATIARLAGIGPTTIGSLRGIGRAATVQVRAEVAARILAVQPEIGLTGRCGYVEGTATFRRLQALQALGFTQKFLSDRLGSHDKHLDLEQPRMVRAAFVEDVRRLYDELWDQDPARFGLRPSAITVARNRAAANGWPPPLAWDDDEIENPNAQPRHVEPDTGKRHRSRQLIEDMHYVLDTSVVDLAKRHDREQVAGRLGIGIDYLDRLLKTAAEQADTQVDGDERAAHTGEQVGVGEAAAAPGIADRGEADRPRSGHVRQPRRLARVPVGAQVGG
jgi:hypothetical protein